jgi:hypothetical protein
MFLFITQVLELVWIITSQVKSSQVKSSQVTDVTVEEKSLNYDGETALQDFLTGIVR